MDPRTSDIGHRTSAPNGAARPSRREAVRILQITAVFLAVVVLFAFVATLVLGRTDWGRERVRRFVIGQLQGMVHGQVTIGRVRGNLLNDVTIDAFAIRDSAGRPFVAAERVSAQYSIFELLTRKIDLRNVHLVRPLIVLDRPPGGKWNYQRIFPPSDTTKSRAVRRRGFPWIVLHDVTLTDGQLIMRTPWKPDKTLSRAAQDSSIAEALSGMKRVMVLPVSGGFQKVVELRDLTARAPLIRITQPGFHDRLAQIASLRMVALPFRPPAAVVSDLLGNIRFNNDSIWWSDVAVRMPGSSLRGNGRYVFSTGDMTIASHSRPGAFADFRWVFPRLPSEGGGPLDFALEWRGTTQEYYVRNADMRTQGAHMRGKFAISFADTFAIHDTDIRFTNVSTKLVEQLVPDFQSPRRGTLDGQLTIVGGRNAMQMAGSVAFHDQQAGTSRVAGSGAIGFVRGDLRMRNLRVRIDPLQVALLKALSPTVGESIGQIGGVIVGSATVNGSTQTALAIVGDVTHRDRGGVSRLAGSAGIKLAGVTSFNVNVRAQPLALAELGLFAPSLRLRGSASGPISVRGTLSDMRVAATLRLPDGGTIAANGRLDLTGRGRGKSYDLTGGMQVFNLNAVMATAPRTSLTATVRARGSGFQLATMNGAFAADFAASTWDSVTIDSGSVRVAVSDGLARVDRLMTRGTNTRIDAAGSFGLVRGRAGELRYSVAIDSLGAYNRWIPGGEQKGVVRPRSALVARAMARAREDSARVARDTEVERAATGRPMPSIPVNMPPTLARDALSGSAYAAGTLRGNVKDFDLRGRLTADDLIARGNSAKTLRAEYAWTNARTTESRIAVAVEGRQISAKGFAFDTLEGRISYRRPIGEIQLAVRQGDDRDYSMRGSFVVGSKREVKVQNLALRMDTTMWRLARAAVIHWHPAGMEVHDVELRSNKGGMVYANGMLPTEGNANLVLDIQSFQIADVTTFMQSDLPIRGVLTARGVLEGTMSNPRFRGAAGLVNGSYNGSVIPDFQSTFRYAGASLTTHIEALRKTGTASLIADAMLPINLAFSGVLGQRLLDQPMRVDVSGDSLPLDLIPAVTDMVAQVRGNASGSFAMRGTLRRPSLAGALTWTNGSMRIVPTGMQVENIVASIRMTHDTVFVDSIAGRSGRGPVRLAGHLYVGNWREPSFDLHLAADGAEVLDNKRGRLDADLGLSLTGPFKNAYLSGLVHIRQGVGYVPETSKKRLVSTGDASVFAVMDSALISDRELFPTTSPLLENLRIDMDFTVNRNTWLRSRDANIEMFTEEPVRVHREVGALALTGIISTDRGEYTFLSKRFQIKRGSATFVGGPELNPALQATGEYEIALTGRQNFNIRVLIGGTLRRPKLALESDAQPPISQSDLLSYLAFGRSSTSLLQLEGSGLTGATASGNLIGVGAALAMKRMVAVALGVMADEVEGEATRNLGADVFNIEPADLPTELGGQGVVNFLATTRVEAGKYFSPYFFTALQLQQYPGIRAQYRTPKGWRFESAIEPRYLLQPPSLALQRISPVTSFGAFVIREWRF